MDNETISRLRRKLMNASNEIDAIDELIQVHNEDDESKSYRRLCEIQDEIKSIATQLDRLFNAAEKIKATETDLPELDAFFK